MRTGIRKRVLKVGAAILCVLGGACVFLGIAKVILDARYFAGYDPSAPLNPVVIETREEAAYIRTQFSYSGFRDNTVPAVLATPKDFSGQLPCIVFVHGFAQTKEFLDRIAEPFVKAGFAFVSFDQCLWGERRQHDASLLTKAMACRQHPAYAVNDTRRLIDYLQTRPDIDPNKIYLAGVSYGAMTGTTAAAFDNRIRAVALTYGGGDLLKMSTAKVVAKELGRWKIPAQIVGWYFFSAADPVKYVGRISPRPVFLQNGTDDGLIAKSAAEALQTAAGEPKKIKWYEGGHVGLEPSAAPVGVVVDDVVGFFKEVVQ